MYNNKQAKKSVKTRNEGRIYRIVCNITGENYFGSTKETALCKRLAQHVSGYKSYLKGTSTANYVSSYKIIERGDYKIVLVEYIDFCTREQLRAKERYYIEIYPNVNKLVPNGTVQEWEKEYYEKNKRFCTECGGCYQKWNNQKEKHNNSPMHQNYMKAQESKNIIISQKCFEFLFVCDSYMRLPKSYPNYILTK